MNHQSDTLLISLHLEGDPGAYTILHDRYRVQIHSLLATMVWDPVDVEDIVQQTFTLASQRLGSLKDPELFQTWLHHLAINRFKDWARVRKRARWLINTTDIVAAGEVDPLATASDKRLDVISALRDRISTLPGKYKRVIEMYYIDGMTHKEIAEIEKVSVKTVRQRKCRGHKLLRRG